MVAEPAILIVTVGSAP